MIHSHVSGGSNNNQTIHRLRRRMYSVDYVYQWWCANYHPRVMQCKWFLAISTLCMSIIIILFIPTTTRVTTTNIILRYNNNIQSKPKTKFPILTFHVAFTVPKFTKLNQRCIESVFYFHPTAHLIIHSNMKNGIHTLIAEEPNKQVLPVVLQPIQQLMDLGYHIDIIPYHAADILNRAMTMSNSIVNVTLAKEWMSFIDSKYSQEEYWYSNESNLLRLCLLYVEGGIYLDTDVILVRPMVVLMDEDDDDELTISDDHKNSRFNNNTVTDNMGLNVDNVMARDGGSFECAVMKFIIPGNVFLGHAINTFLRHYNGVDWGNNGPRVFGRTAKAMPHLLCPEPYNYTTTTEMVTTTMALPESKSTNMIHSQLSCSMQPLLSESFQPVPWRKWIKYCFDTKKSPVGISAMMILRQPNVYAVHMNNHIFGHEIEQHIYVKDSVCDIVLTKFCILCT